MAREENPYDQPSFVARYARSRPGPPPDIFPILVGLCDANPPRLVVDLGCGTGLSTLPWTTWTDRVVGIESNPLMLRRAPLRPDIEFRLGRAERMGLRSGSADIVTCSQSFHWMARNEAVREIARVLRRGGVFAVYDYVLPPLIEPKLDESFRELLRWSGLPTERTDKAAHARNLARSGRFRWVRPFALHHADFGGSRRLIDLALSIAHVAAGLGGNARSTNPHWQRFAGAARRTIGRGRRRFWWTYDVVLAVK